jgi:hypothetical protein
MSSATPGLPPHVETRAAVEWDPYDDMPLDPAYVAPAGLARCTKPRT